MEDKKVIKISLSTFFLFLAIIVIVVMGIFMYKLYNEKSIETEKSSELQTQVNILNGTINNLQGKIDSISNALNSNTTNINNTSTENNTNTSLSENEALTILKEKFKIAEKIWLDAQDFFQLNNDEEIKNFDKTILSYGTENLLKEIKNNLPWGIRMENNKYYITQCGGAREYNGFDGFENIKITDSSITATLKTKQTTYNGSDWVSTADKTSEFKLVKKDNNWLIDEFNSSDLN